MYRSPLTAGHRLEGELSKPGGLARVDQVHDRRERGVLVGPENDCGGQPGAWLILQAGGLQVQLHQVCLVLDGLDRLVQDLYLSTDEQMAISIHVKDESVLGN